MADNKLVLVGTHGDEDPERASIPFVMANAALASEVHVSIILQANGVFLATKGYAKHVKTEVFPPLPDLIKGFMDSGGKLMVCSPCLKARGIAEDLLLEGSIIVAGGTIVAEVMSADSSLSY